MRPDSYTINPVAECSVMLRFELPITAQSLALVGYTANFIRYQFQTSIMNVTPSYCSILVDYLPYRISESQIIAQLHELMLNTDEHQPSKLSPKTITLPIYYSHRVGPDISRYESIGITLETLIELHTSEVYSVSAIGFAPSFAFLSGLNEKLKLPRLETPRVYVQKGSVGIADRQTAVYPNHSPGGWNIIGNCPLELYRPDSAEICPFNIGDSVKFESIDESTFLSLGGVIKEADKQ